MSATQENKQPVTLEEVVAKTCFCKLKAFCPDKSSSDCLKNRNIYKEFMLSQR